MSDKQEYVCLARTEGKEYLLRYNGVYGQLKQNGDEMGHVGGIDRLCVCG